MKIQIVQDRLRSGGTERQSILLAHAFAKQGHVVEVVTFRPGGELAETLRPVPHRALQPFDLGLDWFAPGLHGAVKKFSPEIILSMGRMANSWSGSVKKHSVRAGLKNVVIGTMRTGKTLPPRFRDSLHVVDHLVANSYDAAERLVSEYRLPREKVSVINNALVFPEPEPNSAERIRSLRASTRRENQVDDDTIVLLCVAMFRPEKNQRALIDLFAQFPLSERSQLWFVGDGPAQAQVQAQAHARGLTSRVKFFGFQADPERFYAAADIAVLTSRSEALSNFLIEAHAHGLPSIAYDVMGVKECGGTAVALDDEASFVEKMVLLARDPSLREREGARLRVYARNSFAPEKQAGEYLALFAKLIG